MTEKIVPFRPKEKPKSGVPIMDVEQIGFLTIDDRDLWVDNPTDVLKIMRFIVKEKIKITEDQKKK